MGKYVRKQEVLTVNMAHTLCVSVISVIFWLPTATSVWKSDLYLPV